MRRFWNTAMPTFDDMIQEKEERKMKNLCSVAKRELQENI